MGNANPDSSLSSDVFVLRKGKGKVDPVTVTQQHFSLISQLESYCNMSREI